MEISNPRSQIQFHLHPSPPLLQQQQQPQPPPLQFGLKKTEDNKELYVLYNEDDTDFTQHASFDIPLHGPELDPLNKILHVVGTCNGLLCLSDYSLKSDRIFLWNPCVGKYLRLPSPNVTYTTHGVFKGSLGFGFDLKTNDYKVVRVVRFPITPNLPTLQQKVEVYSLSTGQWRMLRDSLVPTCGILTQSSVNGAMHWLVSRTANDNQFDHFGLVFDLHNEVFREIMLPELPAYTRQRRFCRNGHIVLELDGGQLISWDLETQEIKDFGIIGYNFVDSYVESLVLLDKTANNAITY
nr:F-box protein At3g07870-like [Quercus suber]